MATLLSNPTLKTRVYQTDQQVKYLHLEAEVDMLLQRITSLMQRKEIASSSLDKSQAKNLTTELNVKSNT